MNLERFRIRIYPYYEPAA